MRCWWGCVIRPRRCSIRLETRGVYVPREGQREVVRALYVATRNQIRALSAVLELEGLE